MRIWFDCKPSYNNKTGIGISVCRPRRITDLPKGTMCITVKPTPQPCQSPLATVVPVQALKQYRLRLVSQTCILTWARWATIAAHMRSSCCSAGKAWEAAIRVGGDGCEVKAGPAQPPAAESCTQMWARRPTLRQGAQRRVAKQCNAKQCSEERYSTRGRQTIPQAKLPGLEADQPGHNETPP